VRRFRLVAPAGAPLPAQSVLPSIFRSGGDDRGLEDFLVARLGVQNLFFVSSGRAALAILFKALRRGTKRREVVIPAGTLDTMPDLRPQANIFWASRAPWACSGEGLPCHDEYTPSWR